jgi:glutaredoxin 2
VNRSRLTIFLALAALVVIIIIVISNTTSYFVTSTTQQYSDYSNYLTETTDKSVGLTRQYQDEIGLWNQGNYTNITMAKITESFLPRFINQLNEFNGTKAPEEYNTVKENFVKSFASEIKSYELFREYLITNNSTKNELSTDYLSDALTFETIARNAFAQLNNSTK